MGNYDLLCVDWTVRSCCHIQYINKAGNFNQKFLDPLNLKQIFFNNSVLGIPYLVTVSKIFCIPQPHRRWRRLRTTYLLHPGGYIIFSAKYNFLVKRHLRQFNIMTNHLNGGPELVLIGKDCRIMVYIMAKIWLNPLCNFGSLEFQNWSSTSHRQVPFLPACRNSNDTYYKAHSSQILVFRSWNFLEWFSDIRVRLTEVFS